MAVVASECRTQAVGINRVTLSTSSANSETSSVLCHIQRAQDAVQKQKQKEARAKKKAAQAARKQPDDGIEEFFTEGYLELEKSRRR